MNIAQAQIDGGVVRVTWESGRVHAFHGVWLWDNRRQNMHDNGQRLGSPRTIALDACAASVSVSDEGRSIQVAWATQDEPSEFHAAWLLANAYDEPASEPRCSPRLWRATDWNSESNFAFSDLLEEDNRLAVMLRLVRDDGLAFVRCVPPSEQALFDLVARFGFVRETNYGRSFEVRAAASAENLAYTSRALAPHTDNPYREPPPTLQVLQVMKHAARGGESTFADGFAVADALRRRNPQQFALLASYAVTFRYRAANVDLIREAPVLQTDRRGRMSAVHLNHRSLQPLRLPPEVMEPYYAAYREFAGMVESDEFLVQRRLNSGEAVVFDNTRILHGRTGYADGERCLRGCYADKDSLLSKLRVLEAER